MPITGPNPGCYAQAGSWKDLPSDTPRLRLRKLESRDAPALVTLAGEWEVARQTAFVPHPYTHEHAQEFLTAEKGVAIGIERRAERDLAGVISMSLDGDIGYWIGKPFWGRGFATEALRQSLRSFFGNTEIAEMTASVFADNGLSARVLEKAGFTCVGEAVGGADKGRCAGQKTIVYRLARDEWQAAEDARPTLFVVAAALVDVDGRVLMAQRAAGSSMAGQWEFPGGKVRAHETPEAALVRELREEIGIDITDSCLAPFTFASHAYADFHLLMPLYVCRVWKGTVTPMEGQQLKWVRPNKMRDLLMPPADLPLVAMLRDLL